MHQWAFYPSLAEVDEEQENDEVQNADNEECCRKPHVCRKPIGNGKREIEHNGHDDEEEDHSQDDELEQSHQLVNYIELQVLALKPEVMLDSLCQLGNRFYILVA